MIERVFSASRGARCSNKSQDSECGAGVTDFVHCSSLERRSCGVSGLFRASKT